MSDDSTPRPDGLAQFFRDAPLALPTLLFFVLFWGGNAFVGDLKAAWGSRELAWFLVRVGITGVVAVITAWVTRSQSRARSAATPPTAA